MVYQLTPEQLEKKKSATWKAFGFLMVFIVGLLVFFSYPSFSQLDEKLPQILILWGFTLPVALIGMWVGLSQGRKKWVTQVETKAKSIVLTSGLKQEEIAGDSIDKLAVTSDASGAVSLILLKIHQPPPVILRGFDDMDRLASDLEKIVSDKAKVAKNKATNNPARKSWTLLGLIGVIVAILAVIGGFFWVMAKLGLGFLALPLSFVGMGASRFIGNRRDRKERMTGVGFIFLGILMAVGEFINQFMQSGR